MKRKILERLTVFAFLIVLLCTCAFARSYSFTDVSGKEYYAEAAETLKERGILTGYSDGSFGAGKNISKAEMAAIICRMMNYEAEAKSQETVLYTFFSDVPKSHWAIGYINTAYWHDIINGDGRGKFNPENSILYEEAVKMVVCAFDQYADIKKNNTDWSAPYLEYAKEHGLTNGTKGQKGESINRADVAIMVYNAALESEKITEITVGNKKYHIGMSEEELVAAAGEPDEKLDSTDGYKWYVFGTSDYVNFFMAGVKNDAVAALCASGKGFVYNGHKMGDTGVSSTITGEEYAEVLTDKNDNDIMHCVFIHSVSRDFDINDRTLYNEGKVDFHLVNAFRVYHGKKILNWNENAANAARLHSNDMAGQNYFSHTGLNGSSVGDRLKAQGITSGAWGENISAGRYNGIYAHDGWVNSSGHRDNILRDYYTELGVGAGYNKDSNYSVYFTEDFFSSR